jgi:hypothetical protein
MSFEKLRFTIGSTFRSMTLVFPPLQKMDLRSELKNP